MGLMNELSVKPKHMELMLEYMVWLSSGIQGHNVQKFSYQLEIYA